MLDTPIFLLDSFDFHAGQSVPHVHIHILPRKPGDFEPMDAVYDQLEKVNIPEDHQTQGKRVKMDSERLPVRPV